MCLVGIESDSVGMDGAGAAAVVDDDALVHALTLRKPGDSVKGLMAVSMSLCVVCVIASSIIQDLTVSESGICNQQISIVVDRHRTEVHL